MEIPSEFFSFFVADAFEGWGVCEGKWYRRHWEVGPEGDIEGAYVAKDEPAAPWEVPAWAHREYRRFIPA